jgi:hypothetical protein
MVNRLPTEDNSPFCRYAKRLRSLTLGKTNGHDDIPTLSLTFIASLQVPGKPIFPALKSVVFTFNHVPQTTAIYGTLALASSITRLEFTALEVETASFATMLVFFSNQFSMTLTHLNLTFPVEREFTMKSLRFLPRFRALRSLTLSSTYSHFPIFDDRLVDWILNLASLEVLEIDVCVEPTQLDQTVHRNKHAVSACFRTLKLSGPLNFIQLILSMFAPRGVQITKLTLAPIVGDFIDSDPDPLLSYVRATFPNVLNSFELLYG